MIINELSHYEWYHLALDGESAGSYHCLASDHFPFCPSGFEMLKAYCIVGFNCQIGLLWSSLDVNIMLPVTLTLKHISSSLNIIVVL